ncbi:hypothetical protein Tco_0881787 [Tanacetum coccineum]
MNKWIRKEKDRTEKKENGRKGMIISILATGLMMKAWMLMLTTEKIPQSSSMLLLKKLHQDPIRIQHIQQKASRDEQVTTASDVDVATSAQDKNKGKAIREGTNSKFAATPRRKSKRLRQEEPGTIQDQCQDRVRVG